MTPGPRALVWLPLLAVAIGLIILVTTSVVLGLWVLAGLSFAGAVIRTSGWAGSALRVRRPLVDTALLASFGVFLAFLASSGVLD